MKRDDKMEKCNPPYTINNHMLTLVSEIMKKMGRLNNYQSLDRMPKLRKINRLHSIHSSLAIEANSLSLSQMTAIINGKVVLGSLREI